MPGMILLRRAGRPVVWGLAMLALAACSLPKPVPATQTYAGCFFSGEEQREFRPQGTQEMWWLRGDPGALPPPSADPGQRMRVRSVFLVVEGQLSGPGHYGHMAQYTRTLTVLRVLSVREPTPQDGCLP